MEKIKKIDIHAHVTAFPEFIPPVYGKENRFISAEEVLEHYNLIGVEKGILLPITAPEAQIAPMTNEATKFIVEKYPDRFFWFCNPDPRALSNTADADLVALIEHYKSLGAKGVGEITANIYADDPMFDNLYTACEKTDMPIIIHIGHAVGGCYGMVDELGLPRIEKILKNHPNLKVIGHSQCFWSEISADVTEENRGGYNGGKVTEGRISKLMRKYPNLYGDLSAFSGANAFMRDPEFTAKFIEKFSDRLMYGCDMCAYSNTHQVRFNDFLDKMVADGKISEENYRKFVRDNAIRILKL